MSGILEIQASKVEDKDAREGVVHYLSFVSCPLNS